MRWGVFAIFALAVLSIDAGLSDVLRIESLWEIRPNLCGVLAVFVALSAPRIAALWGCFVIGLLLDLRYIWNNIGLVLLLTLIVTPSLLMAPEAIRNLPAYFESMLRSRQPSN